MKTAHTYKIGQVVSYTNGGSAVLTGTIKRCYYEGCTPYYVIIDETSAADVALWAAGVAFGDCIAESQIK